ncbi:hypothetical protein [Amycolatopsis eburnea]|uniref:Uncharacterized protein n=1 Tax=Amycolatopsis eburnea TaxID=2267691 RepID=A0A3R9F5P7_9PSEU|nr:hypothetical protein [Amycolatopsis eburnea]RSD12018.1 hypothetical protein EIY87_35400 [Amycolatopsis eburnea]
MRKWWLWVLVIALVILVLGLIFGGYRKGTKLGAPAPVTAAHSGRIPAGEAADHPPNCAAYFVTVQSGGAVLVLFPGRWDDRRII